MIENNKALTTTGNGLVALPKVTEEMVMKFLMADEVGKKLDQSQKAMFLQVSSMNQLNPFLKEIYAVPFKKKGCKGDKPGDYDMSLITSYHVLTKRAMASGKMGYYRTEFHGKLIRIDTNKQGKFGPYIEKSYKDNPEDPFFCRCLVKRKDFDQEVYTDVYFSEYYQNNAQWNSKPRIMIEKCAIAMGMRRFFPEEISKLPFTHEELGGADFDELKDASMPAEDMTHEIPEHQETEVIEPEHISDSENSWDALQADLNKCGYDSPAKMKLFIRDTCKKTDPKHLTDEDYKKIYDSLKGKREGSTSN